MFPAIRYLLLTAAIEAAAFGQINITTANYGNARANANLQETILTPATVGHSFGKIGTLPVDGQAYAQPLYLSGVQIPGAGAGAHNIVLIATEHNSVYAYDADRFSLLWQVNLGPSVPATTFPQFTDVKPEIGILSTPVADPQAGVVYVVAFTQEDAGLVYRLHALDLGTGGETRNGPVAITAVVTGSGAGSTGGLIAFDPSMHLQRPGLLLANGAVYIGFGSHADNSPWHGWILSYSADNVSVQLGIYNTTPEGLGGSVWQAGRGLAADDAGSIYVITGNGDPDNPTLAESFLKLAGASPVLTDWFTPPNALWLNAGDYDLAAGAALVPGTHMVIGGDKYGQFYLLDGDFMGQSDASRVQVIQGVQWGGIFNFAIWSRHDGAYVYVQEQGSILKCYRISDGQFNPTPVITSTVVASSPYAGMAISGNGRSNTSAILWETTKPGALHAFEASTLNEIWNSDQNSGDALGSFAKFATPTVANGKVYVPTFSGVVVVYGLR